MPAHMSVTRAYKTELDLNDRQGTACERHAGAVRSAYIWGLRCKQAAYQATGTCPSAIDLHRERKALTQTELPWRYAVSTGTPQEALRNLDSDFACFFRRCTRKRDGKLNGKLNGTLGYPQRQTKKQGLGSFRRAGALVVSRAAVQLPRLGRRRLTAHGDQPTS